MSDNDNLQDTMEDSPEDSPVFKELRKKTREQEKELETLRSAMAEVESAAQRQREETVKSIVDSFGLPGLAEDVSGWVEGEPTVDSVKAALEARSIPLQGDGQPQEQAPQAPISASDVGQRVADVAGGVDRRSMEERLNAAENMQELEAIVAEAGIGRKHF